MKGRGLLIAAGVVQLVGAGLLLLMAVSTLVVTPVMRSAAAGPLPDKADQMAMVMRVVAIVYAAIAAFMVLCSVKLIQRRKWAWVVSLVFSSLTGALLLVGIVAMCFGLASLHNRSLFGAAAIEGMFVFFAAAPVFVDIGLLIGGRHAIGAAPVPTATPAPAPTQPV